MLYHEGLTHIHSQKKAVVAFCNENRADRSGMLWPEAILVLWASADKSDTSLHQTSCSALLIKTQTQIQRCVHPANFVKHDWTADIRHFRLSVCVDEFIAALFPARLSLLQDVRRSVALFSPSSPDLNLQMCHVSCRNYGFHSRHRKHQRYRVIRFS